LQSLGFGCDLGPVRIGIDVGGTKIEGLLLGDDGREAARQRIATPTEYRSLLTAIAELVQRLTARASELSGEAPTIGVGTPGFLQPGRGLIRNANLLCLNDRPLDRDLELALGRPVRLANDAKCFVLSEAIDGAAAPPADLDRAYPDVVFGATLGTGVGGGIVVDGRALTGANGAATEWSHTTLPFATPADSSPYRCVCGHPACIESFISGRGLEGTYRALGGSELRGEEIARRADSGEETAGRAFALYEDRLARALASVINLIDPRVIVLGGGVSNNARIFGNVPQLLERHTVAQDLRTKLVHAAHGDASGVRGAAWLWTSTAEP
jgi:predicted NBD/HSP70 family sugar kinase